MQLIDLYPISAEIFLSIAGMVLLLWGAFAGDKSTGAITVATGLCFIAAIFTAVHHEAATAVVLGGHVGSNTYTLFIKVLLLLCGIGALVLSQHFLKTSKLSRPEYPVLILFATIGMMLMVSAESLLGLYMGLELQSLTLYVLAAFRRDNAKSSEAGLKYFVLGALASGLLLYGISLIYGGAGSILFADLRHSITSANPPVELIIGFVFILAAMSFKISAVPFHMWTPDVYEGAPTPVTAFFAAAPKLAGIALLIKLLYGPFAGLLAQSTPIILLLSVASMAVGAFAAIAQSNIKRMMAYSSIGHVGFALVGLLGGGVDGVQATLLYLLIYLPMTIGTFGIILSLRRDDVYLEQISDFAGLSKTRPALAAIMTVFMFSMMGIPPLAGFFGKFYVFLAAVDAGYAWLAVLGVCLSVVGAFYYLRIIKIMYFDKVGSTNTEAARFIDEGAASNRTVITAKEQGEGRGRGNRTWSSPPGNLYATLCLIPERAENEWPHLCFVLSLAIAEGLKNILSNKSQVHVKWPNDVLVGGRKIGGILLETHHTKTDQKVMLVGFGVNCRHHPEHALFAATHLVHEGIKQADATPEAVLALILQQFEPLYQNWQAMGLKNIRPAWLNLAKNLGETITIRVSDFLPDGGKITGTFLGVDEESGALLLKEEDGLVHRITHGDVFFPDKLEKDKAG